MLPQLRAFDHAIIAIKLPEGVNDPSLVAVVQHPKLGRILFFDPTDDMTPFGRLRGALQDNFGLGSRLTAENSITRLCFPPP